MRHAKFVLLLLFQWLAKISAQFAPSYDAAIRGGGLAGSLPFPLFPMPCEMICEHGGLFFANINIINAAPPPRIGGGAGGLSGNGGGGNGMGGMASGSMNGMSGISNGGTSSISGMGGMSGGMGGMSGSMGGMPGSMGGGQGSPGSSYPTKPPGISGSPSGGFMTTTTKPDINAQIIYIYPSW